MEKYNGNDIQEISNAYFAEEAEMKAGTHPSQIKERIKKCLHESCVHYREITFLDWNIEGPYVKVSLDGAFYGIFDYDKNCFK